MTAAAYNAGSRSYRVRAADSLRRQINAIRGRYLLAASLTFIITEPEDVGLN